MQTAHAAGQDVARLHSGDLSIWSAVGEQTRRLEALGIAFTITPGVPAFAAASAALRRELTLPEVAQSVVLTRTSGRASAMPPTETLAAFAAARATMAIHLSIHALARVVEELTPLLRRRLPDRARLSRLLARRAHPARTLSTIEALAGAAPMERTALILVGPALAAEDFRESALYDAGYDRRFRPTGAGR